MLSTGQVDFYQVTQLDNSAAPHSRAFTSAVRQFETMNEDILGEGIHQIDHHQQVHFRTVFFCKVSFSVPSSTVDFLRHRCSGNEAILQG